MSQPAREVNGVATPRRQQLFLLGDDRRLNQTKRLAQMRHEAPAGQSALFTAAMEHEERRAAIEAALAKLPEPQREVLVMKVWAKLSFPQIGQALYIPPDTAASRYRYALEKLRGELAEELIR